MEETILVVIDGPERAGKTTICRRIEKELGFHYVHWDKPPTSDGWLCYPYRQTIEHTIRYETDTVWDRSWASSWVYDNLLNRGSPCQDNPWQMEWEFGMPTQTMGARFILLGPGGEYQSSMRTAEDQPVQLEAERELYRAYGERFGWTVLENQHNEFDINWVVDRVRKEMLVTEVDRIYDPPKYLGPLHPQVVVISDQSLRESRTTHWLPYTDSEWNVYPQTLGDNALKIGWTDISYDTHEAITDAPVVIAIGENAFHYAAQRNGNVHLFPIPYDLNMVGRVQPDVRTRHLMRFTAIVQNAL